MTLRKLQIYVIQFFAMTCKHTFPEKACYKSFETQANVLFEFTAEQAKICFQKRSKKCVKKGQRKPKGLMCYNGC